MTSICLIYTYFLIPESPWFYFEKKRFIDCIDALEYAKRLNGDGKKMMITF
jgi:hypothetical protein